MAASPTWKVYDGNNHYVASFKTRYHAAMFIGLLAEGTIRYGHNKIVWTEGKELMRASESYDFVVDTIIDRTRIYEPEVSNGGL